MFIARLFPRCSALISALPSKTAFTLSKVALMVLLYLWRMMLSPEAMPAVAAAPTAPAKDSPEEPCLAIASTVRFFAYTFFLSVRLVEESSAAVVRSTVSQFADTPTETPAVAAAPTVGVPVKEPIFV